MKTFIKVLAVSSLSLAFFACSKKMQTFQFGSLSHQETFTTSSNTVIGNTSTATCSNENEQVFIEIHHPVIALAKRTSNPVNTNPTITTEKPASKQTLIQKMIIKKVEKMEKKLTMTKNMRLGLVIAAVSLLVLIIVAAGLLGGLSGLFWLLGGLGLLTGLLIMLLVALDVI